MKRFLFFLVPLVLLTFGLWAQDRSIAKQVVRKLDGQPERRLALIIGNKDYLSSPLKNPLNDADDMSVALRDVGFDVMTYKNLDRIGLEEAIDKFSVALKEYEVGLFYYSGHGIQALGETYLVPTDVRELEAEARVKSKCVKLEYVLSALDGAGTKTILVFLDACRNNPFKKGWSRSFDKQGLSIPAYNPAGSIIVYATDAGSTADDNVADRNGLFTKNLLKHLKTPNLTLNSILNRTRNDVLKTNPNQYPKEYGGLLGDFYFLTKSIDDNEEAKKKDAEIARLKEELAKKSPPAPEGGVKKKFLDLPYSEMVYVEGGTFEMKSTKINSDTIQSDKKHKIKIPSFYIGKYEVTQAQWRAVMGSDPPELYNKNCDVCPVEGVRGSDVREFLIKLNVHEGRTLSNGYRLPTEAEWEYAARGGTHWRDGYVFAGSNNLNDVGWYIENCQESAHGTQKTTHPVGLKIPNQLGVYDMSGNVNELCDDWLESHMRPSFSFGTFPLNNQMVRGGSWGHGTRVSRVDQRNFTNKGANHIGFRLVSPQ